MTITSSTNLSDDDIDRAVKEAEKYAEEDKKRKELVDAKNDADQMIFATEKAMNESADKLSEEDKETLKKSVEKAKEDLKTADTAEKARAIIDEMTKANGPIFTKLYQAAQQEAQQQQGGAQDGGSNPDDVIIDNDNPDNK